MKHKRKDFKRGQTSLEEKFQMESGNNPLVDAIAGALIQSKFTIKSKIKKYLFPSLKIGRMCIYENI